MVENGPRDILEVDGFSPAEKLEALKHALGNGHRHDARIPQVTAGTFEAIRSWRKVGDIAAQLVHYGEYYSKSEHHGEYPEDPMKAVWTERLVDEALSRIR